MALMFTPTANIKKAVGLINGLDSSKFPLLLSRILQKLHLKMEHAFSDEEEEKLQKALQLSASDLQLVLQSCEFFLQQAAYHSTKPAVLSEHLLKIQLAEDKVSTIVTAWGNSAKMVIDKLRLHTVPPKQLQDINWRLHLQMADSTQSKVNKPAAMLELGIQDDEHDQKEKICMEFTHSELYAFYNQLEVIQLQLDSLS